MVDLKEIIKGFCEKCKLELYDNYEINVTDISEYVKSDDTEYYFERKSIGWIKNPKKAAYNKVYKKTSFGIMDLFK